MKLKPLTKSFGIEIVNLDLRNNLNNNIIKKLQDLVYQHQVILLRNQNLSFTEQIYFTKQFGTIEPAWDKQNAHPEFPEMHIISNANYPKQAKPEKGASEYWHIDGSFRSPTTWLTFLHAKQIPAQGGDTGFISLQQAFAELPHNLQEKIKSLKAIHSYTHLFKKLRKLRDVKEEILQTESKNFSPIIRPLVRAHPIHHRFALCLNELCITEIISNDSGELHLLEQLYTHAFKPRYLYRHQWQNGDLLIWDNYAGMHKRFDTPEELRIIHRTSTAALD